MNGNERHLSSTRFQREAGQIMWDVLTHGDVVVVEAHGRAKVVVLSVEQYEALMAAKREWEFVQRTRLTEQ